MKKIIFSQQTINRVIELNNQNLSLTKIAKLIGTNPSKLKKVLRENGIKPNSKYLKLTKDQREWLTTNWASKSAKECGLFLGKTPKQVMLIAFNLNLPSKKGKQYLFKKLNIDPRRFLDITEPEIAYFLGLIWSDGTLRIGDRKVGLDMVREDLELLNLNKWIGKMTVQYKKNKKHPTWKESMKLTFKSRPIYDFLVECDFKEKSIMSPTKILDKIPEHLHHYFFRGWFDGDGHFPKMKWHYNLSLAGSTEQNWASAIQLCKKLNISFRIAFGKNKKGSGSIFIFNTKESSLEFLSYIYQNLENAPYLKRKYENYLMRCRS